MSDDKNSRPIAVKRFLDLPTGFLGLPSRTFLEAGGRGVDLDGEILHDLEDFRPSSKGPIL